MVTTLNILCFGFDVIPSNPLGCLLGNQRRLSFPRDSSLDYKWVQMHSHSSISQDSSVHRWGHHVHPCYNLIKSWNRKITIRTETKKLNTRLTTGIYFAVFIHMIYTRIASWMENQLQNKFYVWISYLPVTKYTLFVSKNRKICIY